LVGLSAKKLAQYVITKKYGGWRLPTSIVNFNLAFYSHITMIQVDNLIFEYPGVRALDNVNLQVNAGDITALVGPNGAGKTTLLRCLAGLATPFSGNIRLNNIDVLSNPREAHCHIGYLPDFYGLYNELTVKQALTYAALSHNIDQQAIDAAITKAAARLDIGERMLEKIETLSRGLSQRLAIAQAIVHEPRVILLDEPASGLDPEARHSLAQLFLSLRDQGMTLIVSSHILSELEEYSNNMIIVRHGKIVDHQLQNTLANEAKTIRIHFAESIADRIEQLRAIPEIELLESDAQYALISAPADSQQQHHILQALISSEFPVCAFSEEKLNMQDAYLRELADTKQKPLSDTDEP
jgi:ABC-2 type transport system ATP-binding protein